MESNTLFALLVAIIGFLGAIIGGRYAMRSSKQETSRIVFDRCYSKIFKLMENDFYSKKLSDEEIKKYFTLFITIFEESGGYYYPSLKEYAERALIVDTPEVIQEMWHAFSWSFDRQYEKVSVDIGLPARSRVYRVNKGQYSDLIHYLMIHFTSPYAVLDFLFISLATLAFFILWKL